MNRTLFSSVLSYGGGSSLGKRKTRRPLSPSASLHLTLKVSPWVPSLLGKESQAVCQREINHWARYFSVKVHGRSVNSNHIHLLVHSRDLNQLRNFLRVLSGQIAQKLGEGMEQFWESLPFSRIVRWGRDFRNVLRYIERNTLEAAGLISYLRGNRGSTPQRTKINEGPRLAPSKIFKPGLVSPGEWETKRVDHVRNP